MELTELPISIREAKDFVANYLQKQTKPLLLWFEDNISIDVCRRDLTTIEGVKNIECHPLYGHTKAILEDKIVNIADHPELPQLFMDAIGNSDAQWFLYHNYIEQLKPDHIHYCLALHNNYHKLVVCLINTYALNSEDRIDETFIHENFEERLIVATSHDYQISKEPLY